MEVAGQLSFPFEVLHRISKHLEVKDILNCSKTCKYLRYALNQNCIWREFLPQKYLQLETLEKRVKPVFEWNPVMMGDRDFKPCAYRVHYARVIQLINNWNTVNFTIYSKPIPRSLPRQLMILPEQKGRGQVFYNDRYIFYGRLINEFDSDGIEVWDVYKEPELHSILPIGNIKYDQFYIIGSNVVVVECKKVCVYQINLPEPNYPLLYSFITNNTEVMQNNGDEHGDICDQSCEDWQIQQVGPYLVSYNLSDKLVVHVWDIVKSTKRPLIFLPNGCDFLSVDSHEKEEWLFRLKNVNICSSHPIYVFALYNNATNTFFKTTFSLKCVGKAVLYKSNLYTVSYTTDKTKASYIKCSKHSFKTPERVEERLFSTTTASECDISPITSVVRGVFILVFKDSVVKMDAVTLETVDSYHYPNLDMSHIVSQHNILGSIYLVTSNSSGLLQLWSVRCEKGGKMNVLSLEKYLSCAPYVNSTMTKLVTFEFKAPVVKQVSVRHFW